MKSFHTVTGANDIQVTIYVYMYERDLRLILLPPVTFNFLIKDKIFIYINKIFTYLIFVFQKNL